jgi:hypothetical protein
MSDISMTKCKFIGKQVAAGVIGASLLILIMLVTGLGQDIPGTGGLTRSQLAEMLVECDGDKPEGYCVADINLRVTEKE